jgi:hypothetical protein
MSRQRWLPIAAVAAAVGGMLWIAKVGIAAAIAAAAADGDPGEGVAIAACYLAGWVFMGVGSTWIGTRLALRRPVPVLAVLALLSPLLVVASYALIDAVAEPTLGQLGPEWFEREAGIVVTGVAWLIFGAMAFRKSSRYESSN